MTTINYLCEKGEGSSPEYLWGKSLTDAELTAIIIGDEKAANILFEHFNSFNSLFHQPFAKIANLPCWTDLRIYKLAAVCELGRRFVKEFQERTNR